MSSERIKQLCDYIDQNKAKNYPIRNEILKSEEDFVKNGYLRMLAVVLQVGDSIQDGQMNLYKRIVSGAEAENSVEDYMRQAMEIEIQEYLDFVSACKEGELKYRFILDAMLLTVDGEEKENRLKFISSFCEDIKLKKEEMSYLVSMAKAILEQSESKYVDTFIEKDMENVAIEEDIFDGYMSGIWTGKDNIYENEKATIFRPESDAEVTTERLRYIQNAKTSYIKITGAKIDLSSNELALEGKEKVIFENCLFIGKKDEVLYERHDEWEAEPRKPLCFRECQEVCIINCRFETFGTRTIWLYNVANTSVCYSQFENCLCKISDYSSDDGKKLGGVIYSENAEEKVYMKKVLFEMCGGRNYQNRDRCEYISNCNVEALECIFKDCYYKRDTNSNYSGGRDVLYDKHDTMFSSDSKAIRCKFENSARFN